MRETAKKKRMFWQKNTVEWQKPVFIVSESSEAVKHLANKLNAHSQIALTCQSGIPNFFKYTNIVRNLHNLQRFDDGNLQFIGLIPDVNRKQFDELYEAGSRELWQQFYRTFFRDKSFRRYGEAFDNASSLPELLAEYPKAQCIHLQTEAGEGSEKREIIRQTLAQHANTLAVSYASLQQHPQAEIAKVLSFLSLEAEDEMFNAVAADPDDSSKEGRGDETIDSGFPVILNSKIKESARNAVQWEKPIFIVSAGRSGSTHLTRILDAHPEVGITSEAYLTHIFHMMQYLAQTPDNALFQRGQVKISPQVKTPYQPWFNRLNQQLTVEMIKQFYLLKFKEKPFIRWGDKFQASFCLPEMIEAYPQAQFVFLVRDGRDRTVSVRKFHKRLREENPHVPLNSFEDQCNIWRDINRYLDHLLKDHPSTYVMHYEKLIAAPHEEVRKLLHFLDLPAVQPVFNYINKSTAALFAKHGTSADPTASINRWKTEMTDEEKEIAHRIMGEILQKFGYVKGYE